MSDRTEHRWVIDGIEEDSARIEEDGERMLTVPRHLLPAGVREGQVLRVTRAAGKGKGSLPISITVDEAGTAAALKASSRQVSKIAAESRKRDKGGDVAL